MQILGALPSLDSFQSLLRYDPRLNTQFKSFPSLFIAIEFKLESSGLKQLLRGRLRCSSHRQQYTTISRGDRGAESRVAARWSSTG